MAQNTVFDYQKFKEIIKAKGYSLASLGRVTGLGRRNIENLKYHEPSYTKIAIIADVLEVSLDEFRK